ncbi:MAG: recombinase family protein [Roseiarcus sp.]
MIFDSARVSTDGQELPTQLVDLKRADAERVFHDKLSGVDMNRPQLRKLMRTVVADDVVLIPAVDRVSDYGDACIIPLFR